MKLKNKKTGEVIEIEDEKKYQDMIKSGEYKILMII